VVLITPLPPDDSSGYPVRPPRATTDCVALPCRETCIASRQHSIANRPSPDQGKTRVPSTFVQLLHSTLPWLSPTGRRIVEAVVVSRGALGAADALARSVGLANRHQLKRQLRREGLPPIESLCGWVRVLIWVMEWERTGIALSQGALKEGRDPAIRFRSVKRTTGYTWGEVQRLGSLWVLLQLMECCQRPAGGMANLAAECA
jgi:hypothetical protein